MTGQAIAKALTKAATPEQFAALVADCAARRAYLRERIPQLIEPDGFHLPIPPERLRAIEDGPNALRTLEAEVEAMQYEVRYLDELERLVYAKAEQTKAAAIREGFSKARSKLPTAIKRVRTALLELDDALEGLRVGVAPISELASLPNEAFPLTDDEAADLLELREAVWVIRHAPVMIPPVPANFPDDWRGEYPRSLALMFERLPHGGYRRRPAPKRQLNEEPIAEVHTVKGENVEPWYRSSWR